MIEKMAVFGGTSAISNATFAVAGSDLQAKQNIKDDWKSFFDDMEARSNGINNPELHEVIAWRSPDAYNFIKSEGAKFEDTLSTVGCTVDAGFHPRQFTRRSWHYGAAAEEFCREVWRHRDDTVQGRRDHL